MKQDSFPKSVPQVDRLTEIETDAQRLLESALEQNLELTYEQRIEAHENARRLMRDLQLAGKELHAGS